MYKPTFYTFYTSHLRWNSTVYHTDLPQNAALQIFSRQILDSVNIQDEQLWAFSETVRKISKITYTASRFNSHFWWAPNLQWTLIELRFNIINNLLFLFFLFKGFITMCNLKKRLIRAQFWDNSCKRCSWTTENERTAIKIARETTNND